MQALFKLVSSRIIVPSDAEIEQHLISQNETLLPTTNIHSVASSARSTPINNTSSNDNNTNHDDNNNNNNNTSNTSQDNTTSNRNVTNIPSVMQDSNASSAAVIHSTRTRGRSIGSFDYNEKLVHAISTLSPTSESSETPSPINPDEPKQFPLPTVFDNTSSQPGSHPGLDSRASSASSANSTYRDFSSYYYNPAADLKQSDHYDYKKQAQVFSFKLYRSRFRITQNISVPLALVLVLPMLVLGFMIWLLLGVIFGGASHGGNGILPSLSNTPVVREIAGHIDKPFVLGCLDPLVENQEPRANAVLVVLARNKEIEGVLESMNSLERHWNRWFNYPYVFLNDEPFNSTFKNAIRNATKSEVKFGQIDPKVWNFPEWADEADINESIAKQGDNAIMYGGMASYHRMCRFYSGAFFDHPLLAEYTWYWRVEPEVKYFCDITYDPFKYMEKNNKVYGFTIVIKELVETVPNLFRHTAAFKKEHNITSRGMWEMFLKKHEDELKKENGEPVANKKNRLKRNKKDKLSNGQDGSDDENFDVEAGQLLLPTDESDQVLDVEHYDYLSNEVPPYSINGETYNMCHFWSNFEIARLDFFRSKEYKAYFEALDRAGGFWTERWGDAPVHSLAAGLFLSPSEVHYFRDIGYRHTTIQHCPANAPGKQSPHLPFILDHNDKKQLEEDAYWSQSDLPVNNGVGCRCRCDTDVVEVEGKDGSCIAEWVDLTGGWV